MSTPFEATLLRLHAERNLLLRALLRSQGVPITDYLTEKSGGFKDGILATTTDVINVDVLKALGHVSSDGYIACAFGTIVIRINQREPITIILGQTLDFALEGNRFWEIEKIHIKASGGAASFRMLLI